MSFDHIRDHNFIGFLSQDPGPRINKYGDPKDFTATTIKSTTTFVTKSVSVAAPYWGISGCDAQDMTILKVKMYVSHITYRFLFVSTMLIGSRPSVAAFVMFSIHWDERGSDPLALKCGLHKLRLGHHNVLVTTMLYRKLGSTPVCSVFFRVQIVL